MHLLKYWLIFKMHWQNALTYPVSFFMWRLRQFLTTLTSLTFWSIAFTGTSSAFGYTQETMLSYIFLVALLQSIIVSTFLGSLSEDIYSGVISNTLVRPIKLFGIWVSQELADKSMNVFFVVIESVILFLLFRPVLFLPDLTTLLLFLLATLLGAVVLYYLMLLMGSIGFWSQDTWGIRFLLHITLEFTAGKLYPLDILPTIVRQVLYLTPFPYLSYIQTQIFLGKLDSIQITQTLFVLTAWIVVLASCFHFVWQKGIKSYGAVGR